MAWPNAHVDPPAVARQRVRRALREARDETPMSQGDVARLLGWSLSKVQRIEGGEVGVSATDLRALLDVYGVTDQQLINRLTEDAHTSRRQRYVTPPEHREHLSHGLLELMQFEQEAMSIRAYQPVTYPGVVQTPSVAEAIIATWTDDGETRRVRYEARLSRREHVIERSDGPEYFLLLDESVIKRRIGGIEATAEQLDHLLELAQRPRIHVRVVPLARGGEAVTLGAFQVLDRLEDDSVLYVENYKSDVVLHNGADVDEHRVAFARFWNVSLTEESTLFAIRAEAASLRLALEAEQT
jgi:transcriptional regulator with XRE-family HTH domain